MALGLVPVLAALLATIGVLALVLVAGVAAFLVVALARVVVVVAVIVAVVLSLVPAAAVVQLLLQRADLSLKQLLQRAGVGERRVPLLLREEKEGRGGLLTAAPYTLVLLFSPPASVEALFLMTPNLGGAALRSSCLLSGNPAFVPVRCPDYQAVRGDRGNQR